MAKPKSDGTPLAMSFQFSAWSSDRYKPQWLCRNSRSGRAGCMATLWMHCPNSGYLLGVFTDRMPRFCAVQVRPAVFGAVHAARRNRHVHAPLVSRIEHNGVQGRDRRCPASSGDGADDRTDPAPTTMSPPRREFQRAPPAPRRNTGRRVRPAGQAQSARCSSAKAPVSAGNRIVASCGVVQLFPKSSLDRSNVPQ